MADLCGEFTGSRVDLLTGEVRAGCIWCKSWHCEHCAPIRQKQLMAQAAQGEPTKFITLTSKRDIGNKTPDQAAQEIVHAWRMVIQRGKREKLFTEMQYIAVFELTKKGWPHLHILARCAFIPQQWLSDRMKEYCGSPIVDVRKVKSRKRAAWYVAKYTSKAPEKFQGCKRYWRTLSYSKAPKPADKPVYDFLKGMYYTCHVSEVAEVYQAHGYTLNWDSDHSFTAYPNAIDFFEPARRSYFANHSKPYKERPICTLH